MLWGKVARCCGHTDRLCTHSMVSKSRLEIRTHWAVWESPVLWVVGGECAGVCIGFQGGRRGFGGWGFGGASQYQAVARAAPTPPQPTSWTLEAGRQAGATLSGKCHSAEAPCWSSPSWYLTPGAQPSTGPCFGSSPWGTVPCISDTLLRIELLQSSTLPCSTREPQAVDMQHFVLLLFAKSHLEKGGWGHPWQCALPQGHDYCRSCHLFGAELPVLALGYSLPSLFGLMSKYCLLQIIKLS